jgi:hypothetical protein
MKYDCDEADKFVVGITCGCCWILNDNNFGRGIAINGFKGRCKNKFYFFLFKIIIYLFNLF